MRLVQPGIDDRMEFISSTFPDSTLTKDLLTVSYVRTQRESPDFLTVRDGVEQVVDVHISTVIFRAAPEPVVALYDFIMNTFVPADPATANSQQRKEQIDTSAVSSSSKDKIRVDINLASVQGMSRCPVTCSTKHHQLF